MNLTAKNLEKPVKASGGSLLVKAKRSKLPLLQPGEEKSSRLTPWSFDYIFVPKHSPQQSRIQASKSLLLPVLALCSLSGTDRCFCQFPRASSTAESIPLITVWLSIQLPAGCAHPQSQLCFSDVQAHHTARRKSENVRANLGSVCSKVSVCGIQKKEVLVWEYTTHTHTHHDKEENSWRGDKSSWEFLELWPWSSAVAQSWSSVVSASIFHLRTCTTQFLWFTLWAFTSQI